MSLVPDISSEIERKTLGAIQKLLNDFQMGTINNSELYYGIRGVWDTSSGLVSTDAMDIMSAILANNQPNRLQK